MVRLEPGADRAMRPAVHVVLPAPPAEPSVAAPAAQRSGPDPAASEARIHERAAPVHLGLEARGPGEARVFHRRSSARRGALGALTCRSRDSNIWAIACTPRSDRGWLCRCTLLNEAQPPNSLSSTRSAPLSTIREAKVWRRLWIVTGRPGNRSARTAARNRRLKRYLNPPRTAGKTSGLRLVACIARNRRTMSSLSGRWRGRPF